MRRSATAVQVICIPKLWREVTVKESNSSKKKQKKEKKIWTVHFSWKRSSKNYWCIAPKNLYAVVYLYRHHKAFWTMSYTLECATIKKLKGKKKRDEE